MLKNYVRFVILTSFVALETMAMPDLIVYETCPGYVTPRSKARTERLKKRLRAEAENQGQSARQSVDDEPSNIGPKTQAAQPSEVRDFFANLKPCHEILDEDVAAPSTKQASPKKPRINLATVDSEEEYSDEERYEAALSEYQTGVTRKFFYTFQTNGSASGNPTLFRLLNKQQRQVARAQRIAFKRKGKADQQVRDDLHARTEHLCKVKLPRTPKSAYEITKKRRRVR